VSTGVVIVDPMHSDTSRHFGKLLIETDEAHQCAVVFLPRGSTAWTPAAFTGGSIGEIKGGREQVFDFHSGAIYCGGRPLQD
jgi:hypothetical protein